MGAILNTTINRFYWVICFIIKFLISLHWSLFVAITIQFTNIRPNFLIFTLIPVFFPFDSRFSNWSFHLRFPNKIFLRILFSHMLGPCSVYPILSHLTTIVNLKRLSYENYLYTIFLMLLQLPSLSLSLSLSHTHTHTHTLNFLSLYQHYTNLWQPAKLLTQKFALAVC